jgi:hypothetical protein
MMFLGLEPGGQFTKQGQETKMILNGMPSKRSINSKFKHLRRHFQNIRLK